MSDAFDDYRNLIEDRDQLRVHNEQLRADLSESRRLLDEARTTLIGIAGATARAWELPRSEFIDEFLPWAQSRARDTAAKIAAPVPAQPAAPVVSGQNPVAYGAVFNGRWMANVCRGSLSAAIAQSGINTEIIPLVPQPAAQPATVAQVPEPINAVYFDVPAQPKSAYVMGWNDCIESMLSAAPSAKGG